MVLPGDDPLPNGLPLSFERGLLSGVLCLIFLSLDVSLFLYPIFIELTVKFSWLLASNVNKSRLASC